MFEFQWPWLLLLLPLPFVVRKFAPATGSEREQSLVVPFLDEFDTKEEIVTAWLDKVVLGLLFFSWLALVIAMARPVWVGDSVTIPMSTRNIILAVDLSGSMEQRDFRVRGARVSRLAATKKVATDFIARRSGDRIGLILFGSHAYLQAPLTRDLETVTKLLNEAELGLAGNRTALGNAVGLAVKKVQEHKDQEHVLILMTDGAATVGVDVEEAARMAAEADLKIYTVGIGSTTDESKTQYSSDLDEATLKMIADKTGGYYFRARDTKEFETIYQKLDELEPVMGASEAWRPVKDLFYWPLLLFALSLISLIVLRVRASNG